MFSWAVHLEIHKCIEEYRFILKLQQNRNKTEANILKQNTSNYCKNKENPTIRNIFQ